MPKKEKFTIEERAANLVKGKLDRWDESKGKDQAWVTISEIVVPTERDKQQLLAAIKYLHFCDIDTGYLAVNYLIHIYQNPDLIKVKAN